VCVCGVWVCVCPNFLHGSSINEAAETVAWLYYIRPLTQRRNIITAPFFPAAPVFAESILVVVLQPYTLLVMTEMALHLQADFFCLWGCQSQNPSLCKVIHAGVGAVQIGL
jgi:hypothetical protein